VTFGKFLICLGLSSITAAAACAGDYRPVVGDDGPPLDNLSFLPDYSDEFEGDRLDDGKWSTESPPYAAQSWSVDNVAVGNGVLRLTVRNRPKRLHGMFYPYTAGRVSTKAPSVLYGYFESRFKAAPLFPGVCPAFWAYRRDDFARQWTEIDFVELTQASFGSIGSPRRIDCTLHAFRLPNRPEINMQHQVEDRQSYLADFDPRDDFHVYGCWWTEQAISWYLDGKRICHRERNLYWHQPLDVLCAIEVRPPLEKEPTPQGFPTTAEYDYVRVWKVGERPASGP